MTTSSGGRRTWWPAMHNGVALPLDDSTRLLSEEALVRAAQQDRAAFGVLYDRYLDRVYAYVRTRTTTEDDAADLTQRVFLQALAALPKYRVRTVPFTAWLFRIARNTTIDFHRRQRDTITWDLIPEALQPIAEHEVETGVLHREDIERLRALLQTLDPETRDLLALRYAARLTTGAIAAVIGKTEAATKKRLARALHNLKEQYHATL